VHIRRVFVDSALRWVEVDWLSIWRPRRAPTRWISDKVRPEGMEKDPRRAISDRWAQPGVICRRYAAAAAAAGQKLTTDEYVCLPWLTLSNGSDLRPVYVLQSTTASIQTNEINLSIATNTSNRLEHFQSTWRQIWGLFLISTKYLGAAKDTLFCLSSKFLRTLGPLELSRHSEAISVL